MKAVRFRSIVINRIWQINRESLTAMADFPVGLLLRESGWVTISCRPCEVELALSMLKGWGITFGTMAFRRHNPNGRSRSSRAWQRTKNYILREDLQEVVLIGYKPPLKLTRLKLFGTKARPFLTNLPSEWETSNYWRISTLWGYPRLEIWGRPQQGSFDPKRWTRIGPRLDGMPIEQSLWLEHAKRFSTPLALPSESLYG